MSLINEALKKAQKQRTGDAPSLTAMPAIGGESAARIARRGKSSGPNLLLWGGVALLAVLVLGIGAFALLRRPAPAAPVTTTAAGSHPAAPTTFTPAPPAPASSTITPVSSGIPPATASIQPVASVTAPVVNGPAPSPIGSVTPNSSPARSAPALPPTSSPATAPSTSTIVLAPAPVEPAPVPAVSAPAPVQPTSAVARKLEPRAINFINSIRVAGIRASANDSKVLMNDRVYRIGNIVEAEMGLKLVEITANSLTFEDENGARFTRTF